MSEGETSVPAIETVDLHKNYVGGDGSLLEVLRGVNLAVGQGESVAIIGQSGSGKSTLLHLLGGLDRPTSGEVRLGGRSLASLNEDDVSTVRNERIGFVFQFHHLLREFTVLENVMMPQLIARKPTGAAREKAEKLVADVGLASRIHHKPSQLSGGEQQRVAVARALANDPVVVLADEPSGNLDPETSDRLHDVLFHLSEDHGTALVLVTHNMVLASRSDRVLEVVDGRLEVAAEERYDYARRTIG